MKEAVVFPIEVDLSRGTFTYDTSSQFNDGEEEEEEEEDEGEEATEGGAGDGAHTGDLISTDWVLWENVMNSSSYISSEECVVHISYLNVSDISVYRVTCLSWSPEQPDGFSEIRHWDWILFHGLKSLPGASGVQTIQLNICPVFNNSIPLTFKNVEIFLKCETFKFFT